MSKKSLTIIILFLLVTLGILGYLYLLFGTGGGLQNPGNTQNEPRRNFFFFGNNDPEPTPPKNPIDTEPVIPEETEPIQTNIPRLQQLSTEPVAGAVASSTMNGAIVRYTDRGTGHVHESSIGLLTNPETISNTTIPKIYEALWNNTGDSVLLRYPNDNGAIRTFSANVIEVISNTPISTSTATSNKTSHEIKGVYLTSNIHSVALSPKTDRMFYLTTNNSGSVGYIATLNESSRTQLFNSPLKDWQIEWPEESVIALTTKPTDAGTGYLYFMDAKTGNQEKIISGVRGLTTRTNKNAEKVIYSSSVGDGIRTYIHDVKSDLTREASFITLPEKCVWGNLNERDLYCAVPIEIPSGSYPDVWYQGKVSFVDQIWYINTDTNEARLLANLYNESGKAIDAVDLKLDNREDYLIFTNKNDLTLWSLEIAE